MRYGQLPLVTDESGRPMLLANIYQYTRCNAAIYDYNTGKKINCGNIIYFRNSLWIKEHYADLECRMVVDGPTVSFYV